MMDDTVKAAKVPEIKTRMEILGKSIESNAVFIDRLDEALSIVLARLPDAGPPAIDSPAANAATELGEQLSSFEDRIDNNNAHLETLLNRLEI